MESSNGKQPYRPPQQPYRPPQQPYRPPQQPYRPPQQPYRPPQQPYRPPTVSVTMMRNIDDWNNKEKIDAIMNDIRSGVIQNENQLKQRIEANSKKKNNDGSFIPASNLSKFKTKCREGANKKEMELLQQNDKIKQLGIIKGKQRDEGKEWYKINKEKVPKELQNEIDQISGTTYDWALGREIVECAKDEYSGNIEQVKTDMTKLIRARDNENMLFAEIAKVSPPTKSQGETAAGHQHWEERDNSTLKQIETYLSMNEDELTKKIKNIKNKYYSYIWEQKYLKYKAKYLALKKQLNQ